MGGENSPLQKKKLTISLSRKTAAKSCALNLFFGRDMNYKYITETFLLMDNRHRKLFVIRQSEGCRFMPKMNRNVLAAGPAAGSCYHHHHHHHFNCPIIQQYAHLHEYDSRRAGQQGPIRTLTATSKRSIKTVTDGCIFYHTNKKYYKREKLEKSIFSMLFLKRLKMHCCTLRDPLAAIGA